MTCIYDYLALQLQQRGIDPSIYAGHIIEILDGCAALGSDMNSRILQLIETIKSVDIYFSDTADFATYLVSVHARGYLLPEEEQAIVVAAGAVVGTASMWSGVPQSEQLAADCQNYAGGDPSGQQLYWMTLLDHLDHVLVTHFNCAHGAFGPDASYQVRPLTVMKS